MAGAYLSVKPSTHPLFDLDMKYIDAEKLRAEIEKVKKTEGWCQVGKDTADVYYARGFRFACNFALSLIDSLQQDQPETSNNLVDVDAVRENFITEVYRVLDADPTNDRANAIIYAFDSLPTVSQEQLDFPATDEQIKEFLATHPKIKVPEKYKNPDWLFKKQERPEVDIEKEIDAIWNPRFNLGWDEKSLISVNRAGFENIARYFYLIGLNARKEDDK